MNDAFNVVAAVLLGVCSVGAVEVQGDAVKLGGKGMDSFS